VALPLLLASIAGTIFAATTITPDYVATSYVQLVPPAVTPKQNDGKAPQPRNPWLDLGVSSLGKASILTVQDQKVVEQLKKTGFSDTFTLTLDSTLPIVTFEVIAGTEEKASSTNEQLVKRFEASVAALQVDYGAAKDQSITARRLDLGTNITESTSKVKRALVAIAGVSILLTIAITVVFDAVLRRRAQSKAGRRANTDDEVARGAAEPPAGRQTNKGAPSTNGHQPAPAFNSLDSPTEVIRQRPPVTPPAEHPVSPDHNHEATIVLPREVWQATTGKGKRH
jgi:hypothetical protein